MSSSFVRKWIRFGLLGGATLVLTGCPEDAADITEQASEPAFNFPIASAFVEPEGTFTIDNFILADIDTTVSDAFDRTANFQTDAISFVQGCRTATGPCEGIEFPMRNVNEDPRLPALGDPDAAALAGIIADSVFSVPLLVLLANATLKPNTDYTVTVERLALDADQGLDASNVLLNNSEFAGIFGGTQPMPDNPDQLSPLGGTPGTALGDNPLTIATFTTDVDGFAFIAPAIPGADENWDTNVQEPFDLPNYNYMVIYEGDVATGTPVLRGQFGVDLVPTGEDVNNGLAPFPQSSFTAAEMLAASGGAGRPDSVTVTFNNLEELADGRMYEAWFVNEATGDVLPAKGTYNKFQIVLEIDPVTGEILSSTDSLVETQTGANSFVGDASLDGFRHQLVLSDAQLDGGAGDTVGFYNHVLLTMTNSPGGSMPAQPRPIWLEYTDQAGTPTDFFDDSFTEEGTTVFGNFDLDNPPASRAYIGVGQGTGGVRALARDTETGLVTAGILSADLQALSRPPVGYVLQGWVVSEDGETAFRTQPITGPPPEFVDITSADTETFQGIVTQNGILNANFRLNSAEAGIDFTNFFSFMVTLEPKAGIPSMGPIPVQSGVLPEEVTTPVVEEEE